jgi:hypothetical protein
MKSYGMYRIMKLKNAARAQKVCRDIDESIILITLIIVSVTCLPSQKSAIEGLLEQSAENI